MAKNNLEPKRCPWPDFDDPLYLSYHDKEWGIPLYDDNKIFEFIILEIFQAGLSWRTVLHKREAFRKAFKGFDPKKVVAFRAKDINSLLGNADIIRNRMKIEAAVTNAARFLEIQKEFGSFSKYMWTWVKNKPIRHALKTGKDYPVFIDEAIQWSKDLKKRGFKFLGPTVLYAHMQAVGMVNDHLVTCFRYKQLSKK